MMNSASQKDGIAQQSLGTEEEGRNGAVQHCGMTVGLNSLTHLQVFRKVSDPQHLELMFDDTELPIALA